MPGDVTKSVINKELFKNEPLSDLLNMMAFNVGYSTAVLLFTSTMIVLFFIIKSGHCSKPIA